MNRGKLAAKVKADWLEGRRRYEALIELNPELDEDDPVLAYFRLLIRRLTINREYAFAIRRVGGQAPPEALRVRSDSHRIFKHLRRGIARYASEKRLTRLNGEDYEVSKRAGPLAVKVVPPVFVEDRSTGLIYELCEDGWVMPDGELLDL